MTITLHSSRPLALTFALVATSVMLAACSSSPAPLPQETNKSAYPEPNKGRYSQATDSIPLRFPTPEEMMDPEPQVEPLSRGGNKPYNIYGINYNPTTSITEFSETGIASWYGNKFHGHKTSNGEVYDVFAMTAAHKTLPLPSYVRVTNLDNFRSAIVRVNDRGPFHEGRVIDLSYSAAYKLGIFQSGTGRVKVELLTSPAMQNQSSVATPIMQQPMIPYQPLTEKAAPAHVQSQRPIAVPAAEPIAQSAQLSQQACYIQLIASSDQSKVQRLGNELTQQWSVGTRIETAQGIFRLMAGPIEHPAEAANWLDNLKNSGYPDAFFTNKRLCGVSQ